MSQIIMAQKRAIEQLGHDRIQDEISAIMNRRDTEPAMKNEAIREAVPIKNEAA